MAKAAQKKDGYAPRMQSLYEEKIRPEMQKQFNYSNVMQVPRVTKIVVNMGVGKKAVDDSKVVQAAANELSLITGQKAIITKSRMAIAGFKLREGLAIGCKVTLRSHRMYEFMDRLVNVAMPRIRDFRGISPKSFDGRGNYTLGLKEQLVFPEINYDKVDSIRGMDITVCTTATNDNEARALLAAFQFPFIKQGQ